MIEDFGFDEDLDFSTDFQIDNDFSFETDLETRYMKPIKIRELDESQLKYEKAEALAKDLKIEKGTRQFVIVSGAFIFGDLIEAILVGKNCRVKNLTISTLSLSQNNIDSLRTLLEKGYCDTLNLIVSTYFYSHETKGLIDYLYKRLDIDDRFQLAVADVHTKIAFFETYGGRFVTIHGSANLRSSNCVEQIVIEEGKELFDFVDEFHTKVIEKFHTINKSVRNQNMLKIINSKKH